MARDKDNLVTQRQQGFSDRLYQGGVITAWEVGAAYAAGEQHITNPGEFFGLAEQDDVARSVARTEIDLQLAVAHFHLVTLLKPAVRRESRGMGEAKHLALPGQHVEPEGIFFVGACDGYAGCFTQLCGGAHVIQMAMGQQDVGQGKPALGDGCEQLVGLATRVNQRRLVSLVTPDELVPRSGGKNGCLS